MNMAKKKKKMEKWRISRWVSWRNSRTNGDYTRGINRTWLGGDERFQTRGRRRGRRVRRDSAECNYKEYTPYRLFHRFHCGSWAHSFTGLLRFPLFVSSLPAERGNSPGMLCWMEKAGKHCLTWNSMTCGRQGGGQTRLTEQGVLWGLGNLVKESKFKTNGRDADHGSLWVVGN